MKMLIPSLHHNNIYMSIRSEMHTIIKSRKYEIIVHLLNDQGHIGGYSLIRLNHEGLLKFRRVGHNANYELPLELDHEEKLCISGVDLI